MKYFGQVEVDRERVAEFLEAMRIDAQGMITERSPRIDVVVPRRGASRGGLPALRRITRPRL